jgi:uncharacterized protein (DUF1778 family)
MPPPKKRWKPKGRRRQAKLTARVAVLVTPRMSRSVRQAAALFGMSTSSFVRAALIQKCEAAHSIRPTIDAPEEQDS